LRRYLESDGLLKIWRNTTTILPIRKFFFDFFFKIFPNKELSYFSTQRIKQVFEFPQKILPNIIKTYRPSTLKIPNPQSAIISSKLSSFHSPFNPSRKKIEGKISSAKIQRFATVSPIRAALFPTAKINELFQFFSKKFIIQ